jgi:molybdate transport system permease protein
VLAPSVRQAFEFVTTGNVEVAIVGGALARESRMRAIAIDPSSHEPITQALGVVSSTQRLADAEGLRSFLLSERGQAIFARSGFLPPGATESSPPSIPRADSGEILGPLWLSIRVAGASTLLVACLGLPLAIVLARCRFPGRSLISGISVLPLVLPPTVLGFVLLQILGRSAPLGAWLERSFGLLLVFNWPGAVIASAVAALPLFLLPAKSAIEGVNPALEDVARLLGRNEGAVFRTVTLPLAWRGVAAGLALSFARAMGDFGATLMVAGDLPGRTRTASIAIFRAVETGNLGMAALLSAAVSIISLAALGGVQRLQPASRTAA